MPAAPTHRRPPGRYDEPGRAQRVTALVGAVALAALVVAGGYALYDRSNEGRLSYQARGYAVSSDTAVRISFEVRLARGQRGECKLRARGRDGRDVGSAIVPVGPGTGRALATSYALTTTGRASTGEVVACQVPRRP